MNKRLLALTIAILGLFAVSGCARHPVRRHHYRKHHAVKQVDSVAPSQQTVRSPESVENSGM